MRPAHEAYVSTILTSIRTEYIFTLPDRAALTRTLCQASHKYIHELSGLSSFEVNLDFLTCTPIMKLPIDILLCSENVLCSDSCARHTRAPLAGFQEEIMGEREGANGPTRNNSLSEKWPTYCKQVAAGIKE